MVGGSGHTPSAFGLLRSDQRPLKPSQPRVHCPRRRSASERTYLPPAHLPTPPYEVGLTLSRSICCTGHHRIRLFVSCLEHRLRRKELKVTPLPLKLHERMKMQRTCLQHFRGARLAGSSGPTAVLGRSFHASASRFGAASSSFSNDEYVTHESECFQGWLPMQREVCWRLFSELVTSHVQETCHR